MDKKEKGVNAWRLGGELIHIATKPQSKYGWLTRLKFAWQLVNDSCRIFS
jgi:hypothetical protein